MNILMVPYLFFKDFRESSGVLCQADFAKALVEVGHNVTVLLPDKAHGGWQYEAEDYFGTHPRMSHYAVPMVRNQMLWGGMMTPEMAKVLTPVKSPLLYDVILNGNPPAALAWERHLAETGFANDLHIPIVNYLDIASVPEEVSLRGGLSEKAAPAMQELEMASGLYHRTLYTNHYDYRLRREKAKERYKPYHLQQFLSNTRFTRKPMVGIEPTLRSTPDPSYRVFIGRGFGPSREESGAWGGKCHEVVVDAVVALNAMGIDTTLVLCTASDIENDWFREQQAKLGAKLELHHKVPRSRVLEVTKTCHVGVDLRMYDGLYLAALEQMLSGMPVIVVASKYLEGTVPTRYGLDRLDLAQLTALLKGLHQGYSKFAQEAFGEAVTLQHEHSPEVVGKAWSEVLVEDVLLMSPRTRYKSYHGVFEKGLREGPFEEVEQELLALTDSGKWGRMPRTWVMKMVRTFGFDLEGCSNGGAPQYQIVKG